MGYNRTMKKQPSQTRARQKKLNGIRVNKKWLAILVAVFVLLITVVVWFSISTNRDAARFQEAEAAKDKVFSAVVAKIGDPIATDEKNVCYNSEQGPYDNGRLWCQTASAAYFSFRIADDHMHALYHDAIQSSDVTEVGSDFYGSDDLRCRLETYAGEHAKRPAYYLDENARSSYTVVMSCIDRAKAKHYPFVD